MRYERGRYRTDEIVVKEIEDGARIVFYDERKIYLFPKHGCGTVFHRWGAPRGFYGTSWKIFRQRLMKKKKLSCATCRMIATEYDVPQLIVHKTIDEIIGERRVRNWQGKK